MPSRLRKKRAQNRKAYETNKVTRLARLKNNYISNSAPVKEYSREYHKHNGASRNAASQQYYNDHKDEKRESNIQYYNDHKDEKRESNNKYYASHLSECKASNKNYYEANKDDMLGYFEQYYLKHKHEIKAYYKCYYQKNKKSIIAARKSYYASHRSQEIAADRAMRLKHAKQVVKRARKYYVKNKQSICADMKRRYELAEPKPYIKSLYITKLGKKMVEEKRDLFVAFKKQHPKVAAEMSKAQGKRASCSIATNRVVNKVLKLRKQYAGILLKALRGISKLTITEESDFGEGLHSAHTEPFFYEAAYEHDGMRPPVMHIDGRGRYRQDNDGAEGVPTTLKCSQKYKALTKSEVDVVLKFKSVFDNPLCQVRKLLYSCDECPNTGYSKIIPAAKEPLAVETAPLMGHSFLCYIGTECKSMLRILRVASTHYPKLNSFLRLVYAARRCHRLITDLDEALLKSDFDELMVLCVFDTLESIFSNKVTSTHDVSDTNTKSVLRRADLEMHLQIVHAKLIAAYEKQLTDYAIHACCSCHILYKRAYCTMVKFTNDLGPVWSQLKEFMLRADPSAYGKGHYMCNYCKPKIRKGDMPPCCVLNGLETVPIPDELSKLDCLSRQFIQRAKGYQTVVRLGTYLHNVPAHNCLKACKGNMFYLPLPLANTMETLEEIEQPSAQLPEPNLYIIVNGKPTNRGVVWRSLVQVDAIKAAVAKLKEINWVYKNIDDASLDPDSREVIEVVNASSSKMLEKASSSDVSEFQSYTIRNLDSKLSTESDIEQYKMLSVKEDPLSNRQRHLDVMCFPVLYSDGALGEHHLRNVKVSNAEFIKSRLWNIDDRFRKDPQYIFYLMWQKEMREIAAGVYNLLHSKTGVPISVGQLLHNVNTSNEQLESNLSTVFQSVRGTKQYWFCRKGEVQCMVREAGPPTLFLTFSCAEYESPDIIDYLKIVNNVPENAQNLNVGKMCIEDPVSVSRQFSHKFHSFFQTVIVKGEVLGPVAHYYGKKEYQARGAPHYHVLVWIRDAPIIDEDDPDTVLAWVEQRITCQIPDEQSNPELHRLVRRYQMHKCSNYCKRRRKRGNTLVTSCRFDFPREPSEHAKIHCVEEKLKQRKRIMQLERKESEVRVNDYNPLLLMLWKANTDIQFIAESSLALAHYVTGYVTKAEKSHIQDIWDEIKDSGDVYKSLFKLGVRTLSSREVGLYEAADLVLGDHLCEKSDGVVWVSTKMPHKRARRLKNHTDLVALQASDPESEDIFLENVICNYYPKRPERLEDMCLHDFVATIDYYIKDSSGNRCYRKLSKPKMVNHNIYDPNNENQRQDYFYSLLILFVPFRDESDLVEEGETPEQSFQRILPHNDNCSAYHSRLQKMLNNREKLKKINEARQADPQERLPNKEDDNPQIQGEAKSAMQDIIEINAKKCDDMPLEERVEMLNADQRRVYDAVHAHMLHEKQYDDDTCKCNKLEPLRMFISGVGGTGKSFLIDAVRAMMCTIWPHQDMVCAVATPTGLAAFIVGGLTIHRLFQLPIEQEGREAGYWSLSKEAQKVIKTTLKNLRLLVIDEVSMVSSLNLAYIHLRLEEIFGAQDWFGGKNVLFVGDLLQLQPVNGNPVFESISKKTLLNKIGCAASVNIWKETVVYDELTINERQKSDGGYSALLQKVRSGEVDDDVLDTLKDRVIDCSVTEKFDELRASGVTPVCLFPTRKQCDAVNAQMLSLLETEKHKLNCTDEVDDTKSVNKWQATAAKQLEKMNEDCNNTAGLQAVITLAVGARVMLRRNIDVKVGLVNGAMGTVADITQTCVSVKFDHLKEPCDIERVRGKFSVLKNYFVYRSQFPLMLAYAVTIHKCQGLSLDSAIVDLSDKVFAAGLAYVALSRVRSLTGLHLVHFDAKSIRVSVSSLREINRLRQQFRKDLPQFAIPSGRQPKRKLTGDCETEPPSKKRCTRGNKRPNNGECGTEPASKKKCTRNPSANKRPPYKKPKIEPKEGGKPSDSKGSNPDKSKERATPTNEQPRVSSFTFCPVNTEWQRSACQALGIPFEKPNEVDAGASDMPLTCPHSSIPIAGDGNCMFRSLSYIICGSEEHHQIVRAKIVQHMKGIPSGSDAARRLVQHMKGYDPNYASIDDYLKKTGMEKQSVWGRDIELMVFAHLTNTTVFSYNAPNKTWQPYCPRNIDTARSEDNLAGALYLRRTNNHFEVVRCTQPINSNRPQTERNRNGGNRRFHYVDSKWQQSKCRQLKLPFHKPHDGTPGGPNVALTTPDPNRIHNIRGDGNCLFRCFSYVLTGEERHFSQVRKALIANMHNIPEYVADPKFGTKIDDDVAVGPHKVAYSVSDYLRITRMNTNRTWGTDREVMVMAHLLQTDIYVYNVNTNRSLQFWIKYSPSELDNSLPCDPTAQSLYLKLEGRHFQVVLSTLPHNSDEVVMDITDHNKCEEEIEHKSPLSHNLRFHYVDQKWQEEKCRQLQLPFNGHHGGRGGNTARGKGAGGSGRAKKRG